MIGRWVDVSTNHRWVEGVFIGLDIVLGIVVVVASLHCMYPDLDKGKEIVT